MNVSKLELKIDYLVGILWTNFVVGIIFSLVAVALYDDYIMLTANVVLFLIAGIALIYERF